MKKRVLTILICLFPLLCGAQELGRWSIEAVGAIGLKYGPQFSAGALVSYDLFASSIREPFFQVECGHSAPSVYNTTGRGKHGTAPGRRYAGAASWHPFWPFLLCRRRPVASAGFLSPPEKWGCTHYKHAP